MTETTTHDTERDPSGLGRTLKTYLLRDVGYDARSHGQLWRVTDFGWLDAVRQLAGFEDATHAEPIQPGASTMAIYARAPRGSGADWSKIGCVRDETPPAWNADAE
jgi:hypothetical protein